MAKQTSTHAAAAQMIRAELKKHGVAGIVKSDSYSGGNSVRVYLDSPAPWVTAAVEAFAYRFQYGNFDGMTDSYNYDNRNDSIPQVRFVFVECSFSQFERQQAWNYLRANFSGFEGSPDEAKNASQFRNPDMGEYGDTLIWQVLNGSIDSRSCGLVKFWHKPRIKVAA